jgi:TatD DNase family protein
MIDVHCHLNFPDFESDYKDVIKKADEIGVNYIINSGTSLSSSQWAINLAKEYSQLYAVIGIHPHHAGEMDEGWDKKLLDMGRKSNKVIGMGEIGLDYYSPGSEGVVNSQIQKEVFIRQIEMAHELGIPLQIHNRQAGSDILEILKEYKSLLIQDRPGMFHCMSGNVEFLKKVLDLGFYIGFDGNITYKGIAKGEDTPLSTLVENTPIDRILTETDSPFLSPQPYRGSRNDPSRVIIVAEEIARIKNLNPEEIKEKTLKNAFNLFNINPTK